MGTKPLPEEEEVHKGVRSGEVENCLLLKELNCSTCDLHRPHVKQRSLLDYEYSILFLSVCLFSWIN